MFESKTSIKTLPWFIENDNSCKVCIESIIIFVVDECITLCTVDGNAWNWGKAIRDGFQTLFVWLKYFVSTSFSESVSFSLNRGVWAAWSSFTLFPRGTNCSIENSTNWTSGLYTWGTFSETSNICQLGWKRMYFFFWWKMYFLKYVSPF